MARKLRVQYAGAIYHVMNRGDRREAIFCDDEDRERFLTTLDETCQKTVGSAAYPVEYTYDPQGRLKTLKTWQDFAGNGGTAVTTWNYGLYRGFLTSKRFADFYGPTYTYTAAGRVETRA